jgi:dTDP-4-dehydrorhamnose 3,5-epimerase/reductase
VGVALGDYLLHTFQVIGDRDNVVRTLRSLAEQGAPCTVVADQVGRLTFTEDLAAAIIHMRNSGASMGPTTSPTAVSLGPGSWAEVARLVYQHSGRPASDITHTTTKDYWVGQKTAARPLNAALDLAKLEVTGFTVRDQWGRWMLTSIG